MKIRNDFVTNSSSSSFVIGKVGDTSVTKDVVFTIIRDLYKELLECKSQLMEVCDKYRMFYDEENCCFSFKEGNKWDEKNSQIDNEVKRIFNISSWDYFSFDVGWLSCSCYSEYESYWLNKIKTESTHAPFSILDYVNDKEHRPIENSPPYGLKVEKAPFLASESEEFNWYIPCGSEAFNNGDCDFEYCEYCSLDKGGEKCKSFRNDVANKVINDENAIKMILGSVCIKSECGYIPDYVVSKLYDISEYACNHMG